MSAPAPVPPVFPVSPVPAATAPTDPPASARPPRRENADRTNGAPAFDWNRGAPRRWSAMPAVIAVISALFIIAALALTFLRR